MSLERGLAAMNLDMPAQIPRFEFTVEKYHWELVNRVLGTNLDVDSPEEERRKASVAFVRTWDYDLFLNAPVNGQELEEKRTYMGHGAYAQKGRDFIDNRMNPFITVDEVLAFDPWETYGEKDHASLVQRFNDHYNQQHRLYPECVNTTGVYITLMTALVEIFGWELMLTAAGEDPDAFGEVANRYSSWIEQYYLALVDCESPFIYSHDDLVWTEGPFMSPKWYRKYIFPNLERLWDPLHRAHKKIIYLCDGNYTSFLDDIAVCGAHGFFLECFTDLEEVCRKFGKTKVIIGNGDCRILTFGDKESIYREVKRCLDTGRDCPGYFMCISGHIPPNVPVDNALYYNQVYNELRCR